MNNQDPQQENKPGFKPAKNPFMSALGFGGKKEDANTQAEPQQKEVVVGNRESTLVGNSAQQKSASLDVPEPEIKVPEEILYEWQAPEFSYTSKPIGWYMAIFAFFIGLCVLAFFFISSDIQKYVTITLLLVVAIATSIWASRRPKVLNYSVTNYGISIDKKRYSFDDFRAFYQYMDYNQLNIDLVPGKRLGTLVSMPLATPEADEIIETIAHMVPEIPHNEDLMDKLMRRLRF